MTQLNILIYSVLESKRIIYKDVDNAMAQDIEHTFLRECQVRHYPQGGAMILMCEKTVEALQKLEDKYDVISKHSIRRLKSAVSKLKEGDYFFYFDEDKTGIVERKTAIHCVSAMKSGSPWSEMLYNSAFQRYSMKNVLFSYHSYGFDGLEECVGEEDENKRVCRFCGKQKPDVSFDKVAHAIQEALGNKLLICYEECDSCNQKLALTEDNFRYLMDFRRAMYHIPRKGSTKTPSIYGKNFLIKADENGSPELYLMEESLPEPKVRTNPFMMHLELNTPINNERMYKALCKMVIDLIPSDELQHFKNTIAWINSPGDWVPDALPSALLTILPDNTFYQQPILDLYLNNRETKLEAPYCTAIIWLYDVAYMFVVPFVDVDGGRYKYDKALETHWNYMSKMIGILNWQVQDTSNYKLSTPWVNWRIDSSLPTVHIMPKSDPVFEKCFEEKPQIDALEMPEFEETGIRLSEVKSITFEPLHQDQITEDDLRDVTQKIAGPVFILSPKKNTIRIQLDVVVNDTTDSFSLYKFFVDLVFEIDSFSKYINIEYQDTGELESFAFHDDLTTFLFNAMLCEAEKTLSDLRKDTVFKNCSLNKFLDNERFMKNIQYHVPNRDESGYRIISDREIHKIEYC